MVLTIDEPLLLEGPKHLCSSSRSSSSLSAEILVNLEWRRQQQREQYLHKQEAELKTISSINKTTQRASERVRTASIQGTTSRKLGDHIERVVASKRAVLFSSPSDNNSNYLNSLVNKSSNLLQTLKQQYSSLANIKSSPIKRWPTTLADRMQPAAPATGDAEQKSAPSRPTLASRRCASERQYSDSSCGSAGPGTGSGSSSSLAARRADSPPPPSSPNGSGKPPKPPPPPKEVVIQAAAAAAAAAALSATASASAQPAPAPTSAQASALHSTPGRRHALQEQSLERDAALSLKVKGLSHKRTSSIKSALRHAHLGPLRSSADKRAAEKAAASGQVKSQPYELFEPPVTQRSVQRSKRRGAMMSDPRRQMSADTIGLRQLTDEYLHNAGVKPMSASGQCSLVALTGPLPAPIVGGCGGGGLVVSPSSIMPVVAETPVVSSSNNAGPSANCSMSAASAAAATERALAAVAGQQPQFCIENQLYQASKQVAPSAYQQSSSEDSLNHVTILPGNLPWQSDVSIQCELLRAPPIVEFYETTGDLLDTIAAPFRGANQSGQSAACNSMDAANSNSNGVGGGGVSQLSATLKRGLSAISQHHLSPGTAAASPGTAALNVVVGSLKKSLSNTLDISLAGGRTSHLRSQDSLPAYSSLQNEPESPRHRQRDGHNEEGSNFDLDHLFNQLTSRTTKRFAESKKGLQRALSFDCRGYKRLDGNGNGGCGQQSNDSSGRSMTSRNLLSAKQRAHNKSSLCLNQTPRPYLPQSASQVDFQLPLLPFHKMQEAIVAQRRLEPPQAGSLAPANSASGLDGSQMLVQANELACTAAAAIINDSEHPKENFPKADYLNSNADALLCAQAADLATLRNIVGEPQRPQDATNENIKERLEATQPTELKAQTATKATTAVCTGVIRKPTPPRLVLDIPTITALSKTEERKTGTRKRCRSKLTYYEIKSGEQGGERFEDNELEDDNNETAGDDDDYDSDYNVAADEDKDDDGEDVYAIGEESDEAKMRHSAIVVCLPSPNVAIESPFKGLSNSSSTFCLDPQSQQLQQTGHQLALANGAGTGGNQLSAKDIFSRSSHLIKRPSTMVVSDAMSQVAQALNSAATSQQNKPQGGQNNAQSTVLRNRRQAIVPPKLATDGGQSDAEPVEGLDSQARAQVQVQVQVGQLVDVGAEVEVEEAGGDADRERSGDRATRQMGLGVLANEEATVRALRRKRSGGGGAGASSNQVEQQAPAPTTASWDRNSNQSVDRRFSGTGGGGGSQTNLPTFFIEASSDTRTPSGGAIEQACSPEVAERRPDSQMTNIESIVSSGSSTNLSLSGRRGDLTFTSPSGLTVSFDSSRNRRRSSIAVIPQMQICPGDLLVYSRQLIDRMNQPEEVEPPQFLTIDDKKGKNNIWSSFKLFDNRVVKARNELLGGLDDVLATLQPSTFVDEQLSHYKGMLWNEFLYETESRRSACSERSSVDGGGEGRETLVGLEQTGESMKLAGSSFQLHMEERSQLPIVRLTDATQTTTETINQTSASSSLRSESVKTESNRQSNKEPIKASLSNVVISSLINEPPSATSPMTPVSSAPKQVHRSRDPTVRSISSRFREKPKLKRGQTVDSVFRIPLIPSSPLKHAQQHQQTPTAHLESERSDLITIEDDERSTPSVHSGSSSREPSIISRKNRSASTRSRSGSSRAQQKGGAGGGQQTVQNQTIDTTNHMKLNGSTGHLPAATASYLREADNPDSSFETDDALDLIVVQEGSPNSNANGRQQSGSTRTPHQMMRQSSLSTLASTITRTEQKRQRALWDLFQSECTFFFDHLITLKNVYMEPLKKIQVEGFAMFADPDVLFGNLDELCCGVYDFCKEFLYIIMRTLKTRPEELNATDVLIKLYKKNPKIDHLRGVYHRYTLNYINALTYLESLRRQLEFVEFEKWSSRDVRCKKLQLTDLLVAPVQHIMRVPIILKDIESHTENPRDREEIRAILSVEEASLRELDDKMRWLKNFERLLEIQKNISWPSVLELDIKLFIPDFLKEVLSKQPCEKLIVSPRRQIVHEGTLSNLDLAKPCDMHVILFDDMLLLTRRKKGLTKKASTVCKTNSGGSSTKDDGSFKYIVYKQPLSLDRFYVHDVQQVDAQAINLKHLFLLIVMNRFQQIVTVHSFSAPNDDIKQTWLFKIKKTAERWKKNFPNNPAGQQ